MHAAAGITGLREEEDWAGEAGGSQFTRPRGCREDRCNILLGNSSIADRCAPVLSGLVRNHRDSGAPMERDGTVQAALSAAASRGVRMGVARWGGAVWFAKKKNNDNRAGGVTKYKNLDTPLG